MASNDTVITDRFALVSEEIQRILNDRDSRNTKNVIKTAENIFSDFLLTYHLSLQLITEYSNEDLNDLLRKFYCQCISLVVRRI